MKKKKIYHLTGSCATFFSCVPNENDKDERVDIKYYDVRFIYFFSFSMLIRGKNLR